MATCIGLDAHSRTCTYVAKDGAGNQVGMDTIPSTTAALTEMVERFPGATVVLEASAVHEWVYDTLVDQGVDVYPCHPVNIRRVLGKKNDAIDAGFLVDAYRVGALPPSYVPPPPIRALRELARGRAFLVQERTRLKNRVHGILKRRGVRFAAADDDQQEAAARSVFSKRNRARLEAVTPEIATLLDLLDQLTRKIRATECEIARAVASDEDLRRLTTIPGFGALTSLVVHSELGDVSRFPDGASVASYLGLVPKEDQSGQKHHRGHITGRGPSLPRWVLNQAAWAHVRYCPESHISKAYRRVSKRAGKKRAITMVARRLAVVAYCMLRDKTEFKLTG